MLEIRRSIEKAHRVRHLALPLSLALLLLAVYAPALLGHLQISQNHWQFADDVRVLIHPQFRWEDAGLFPGDPIVRYYLASLPDGYALLYRLLGPLVGVEWLSKFLPYLLLLLTLTAIGRTAWRLSGLAALFGSLALALGSAYLLGRMAGGLPRSFALPLLAWGAYCLTFGNVRALGWLVVVAAGFYPMAGVVLGVALGFVLALPARERGEAAAWSLRRRLSVLGLTALAAGLVLVPSTLRLREYGDAISPALWSLYPEAGPGGRFDDLDRAPFPALPGALNLPLLATLVGVGTPLIAVTNVSAHAEAVGPLLAIALFVAFAVLAWTRREGRRLVCLFGAVVVCHTLAFLANLRLFLPERYLAYGVPVLALVALPSLFGAWTESKRRALRAVPFAFNALLLALLGAGGSSYTGLTVAIPPVERPLYAAVAKLPVNALIAGWPGEAIDNVPYLSRRSAFLARETHMPFHTRYTELQRSRMRALIPAYFASSSAALHEFRRASGVTHLLIDRRHYRLRPGYFVPFDAEAARAFAAMHAHGSAALAAIPRAAVFEDGPFVLLDLSRL